MGLPEIFEEAGRNGRKVRPLPFWGWNDDLEEVELRHQIREMARAGLGGFFIHARRGLITPYLGPRWMESVRVAIDESRRCGLKAWLYDEDCWPSGTCSGRVIHGRDHFRQKFLAWEEVNPSTFHPTEQTVALFRARKENESAYTKFARIQELYQAHALHLEPEEVLIHFFFQMTDYVDVLCREATEEFLKSTYEKYRLAVGKEFGRQIPGIFTDEPNYGNPGQMVWSLELPEFFRRQRQYDIRDHLPSLFWDVGAWQCVRFDFYETATRLFILAWTLPIFQWCRQNNLSLCGHLFNEDTLEAQVGSVGAAMPHYEYMQIPGIDHLCRGLGATILPKQASSVAAQFGLPQVLSEMYACSGWTVTFEDLKWLAEWQIALGVNLICESIAMYSLRGCRKRDYPPSLHHQQPWWPYYFLLNDYFARLLSVLSRGQDVVDVLVLHPITSAWTEFSPLSRERVQLLDKRLSELVDFILAVHCDFHFGDELILERHARIRKGQIVVGKRSYRLLVVPDATNIRASTLRLIKRFIAAGGEVVLAGRPPTLVDGKPKAALKTLARQCIRADASTPAGRKRLRRLLEPKITITTARGRDAGQILAHWRSASKEQVFFVFNKDRRRPVPAKISLPAKGALYRLNLETGEKVPMPVTRQGSQMRLRHNFHAAESLLLVADPQARPPRRRTRDSVPRRKLTLAGRWHIQRNDPNALVLDCARYRFNEGKFSEPTYILDIQHLAVRHGGPMIVTLRHEVNCQLKNLAGRQFHLVLEQPDQYELKVNDMRTPMSDAGHWYDIAFRRIDISRLITRGRNIIELRRQFYVEPETQQAILELTSTGTFGKTAKPEVELEAAYLIGDFAVKFRGPTSAGPRGSRWFPAAPYLAEETARATCHNLLSLGYPFFAGRMTLTKTLNLRGTPSPRALLELPPLDAVIATVTVNGQEAGTAWKRPFIVPVGGFLKNGTNTIAITLSTSLRNLLGPHHHVEGELHAVCPESFFGLTPWSDRQPAAARNFRPEYNFANFGLPGPAILRY